MYVNDDEEEEFRRAVRCLLVIAVLVVIGYATAVALAVYGVAVLLDRLSDLRRKPPVCLPVSCNRNGSHR